MIDRAAQDPRELFDVVRADGTPTGIVKPRAAVHRDGDWHRALHVWVVGRDAAGVPFLLAQRRSLAKDTWPGKLDATVGGHYRAGEGVVDALREVEEEIGIAATLADLRRLGTRVCVNAAEPGINDHELQDIFVLQDDRPLVAYRPHPVELAALFRLPLPALLSLLSGEIDRLLAERLVPGDTMATSAEVTMADFIPTVDHYVFRLAVAAGLVPRGEHDVAV